VTKAVETHRFVYDQVFDEEDDNETVYKFSLGKYLDIVFKGGILTCFAYGQTGSGKTYTMQGIERMAINDLFRFINSKEK
jgi:kinesin family protein 2/24